MLNRTPFFPLHQQLGAKFVDFFGWELPIQFTTITQEHTAVRNNVGLFDISHMGQLFVWGPDAEKYLQTLITNDCRKATLGKGIYAHLLNEKGGVIDDIFVFHVEDQKYLIILNASRAQVDVNWMKKNKKDFNVQLLEAPQAAGLALQGPHASKLLSTLTDKIGSLGRHEIGEFQIGEATTLISRTGYTGEDGFEFFAPAGHLLMVWNELFRAGNEINLMPCGLGARDTLRTEVAYPLYGHELDENHSSLESGLSWVVKMEKGDFIGRDVLVKQKSNGLKTRLYGFKVESGGVARPQAILFYEGQQIGTVASGTFSPTLGVPIGMAFFPLDLAKEDVKIKIRQGNRELSAVTVKLPFYKKPKSVLKT